VKVTPPPTETPPPSQIVFVYYVSTGGDSDRLRDLLEQHLDFHPTLVFPPHYFDTDARKKSIDGFKVLQSSKQIEIALSLENEPNLPMLADVKVAGGAAVKWGFDFAWPDDVSAQIARASGQYQQRWSQQPAGLIPPYLAVSDAVVQAARRFHLAWVLGAPSDVWGRRDFSSTNLFIPPKIDLSGLTIGSREWTDRLVSDALAHGIAVINGRDWTDPETEIAVLQKLASAVEPKRNAADSLTAREAAAASPDIPDLPSDATPFVFDYGPWVKTSHQKLAWQALAQARTVLKNYRNSGLANLQRLDAALEEMHTAESGPFLLALGQSEVPLTLNEQNFLATLSNVYRLSGAPIPANLSHWFTNRGNQRMTTKAAEADRPFLIEGEQSLTWNDAIGDDFGDGHFQYPAGHYAKGAFDLDQFSVTWNDTDVTLEAIMKAPLGEKAANVVPLVDVYVDVNRLPDAGSVATLKGRVASAIQREAAWEYAVAMTPGTKLLYQAVPGGEARRLKAFHASSPPGTVSATLSRKDLRGDPRQWRMTVVVMGAEPGHGDDLTPVRILATSGERNFGGAVPGREVPPFIDILAPTADDQISCLQSYSNGAKVFLPYVGVQ
jgi:hypothetical protein